MQGGSYAAHNIEAIKFSWKKLIMWPYACKLSYRHSFLMKTKTDVVTETIWNDSLSFVSVNIFTHLSGKNNPIYLMAECYFAQNDHNTFMEALAFAHYLGE